MYGTEALKACLDLPRVATVLDVGSGAGQQAKVLRDAGKQVTTVDHSTHLGVPDIQVDFMELGDPLSRDYLGPFFNLVWCCHTLEHQRDPGTFLDELVSYVEKDGWLCITVPPPKLNIVGGHMTLWTPGLLLYHCVLAGIDCSKARVWTYGYNISLLVQVGKLVDLSDRGLVQDAGDLEKLQDLFPMPILQNDNGMACTTDALAI